MISSEIAQMIVDRTMAILSYNINVMDENGIILGSGDTKRRGTIHEAVKYRKNPADHLEIHPKEVKKWNGVDQGINLPIYYENRTIGTIGITGPPGEVRKYGELVKMTAEMIIEQRYLLDQVQYDERIRREFLYQWLEDIYANDREFTRKADMLGIDLEIPRIVICVFPPPDRNSRDYLDQLERKIKTHLRPQELVTVLEDRIVIIKTIVLSEEYETKLKEWIRFLHLPSSYVGTPASDASEVARSYERSLMTRKTAAATSIKDDVVFYGHLSLEVLLYDLYQKDGFSVHQTDAQLPEVLIATLKTYVECNGKSAKTADKLYIHRNTLQYRFANIQHITGRDPRNVRDLFYLYATYVLFSSFKEQEDLIQ
ncbi:CdaR family transcriptional regulator [Salimicrobium jeotgali]|uniref:CdaR family transcriptional regulator n=1 Tax=Salimicrobium jeotgali TaxID=1230341 RepID=UPI000C83C9A0|nr:sugar diacid recognition domain-containing protein [Salimicrobium jeotgali]